MLFDAICLVDCIEIAVMFSGKRAALTPLGQCDGGARQTAEPAGASRHSLIEVGASTKLALLPVEPMGNAKCTSHPRRVAGSAWLGSTSLMILLKRLRCFLLQRLPVRGGLVLAFRSGQAWRIRLVPHHALPENAVELHGIDQIRVRKVHALHHQIGRASCRERV